MKRMRVAGVALAAAISTMLGCSSSDTVVAANVQSSNDAEWNGTTNNGRNGGLISPGIPANILSPGSTDTTKKQAVLVRITLDQPGQTPFFRDVKPKEGGYELNRLDENGNTIVDPTDPEPDPKKKRLLKDKFVTIAPFFERFTLPDGWKDGEATMKAEALDASNTVLLSASAKFTVVDNEATYVGVDLKIPDPPKPPEGMGGMSATGGTSSTGGAAGEAAGGSSAATGGTAATGGSAGAGGAGS